MCYGGMIGVVPYLYVIGYKQELVWMNLPCLWFMTFQDENRSFDQVRLVIRELLKTGECVPVDNSYFILVLQVYLGNVKLGF